MAHLPDVRCLRMPRILVHTCSYAACSQNRCVAFAFHEPFSGLYVPTFTRAPRSSLSDCISTTSRSCSTDNWRRGVRGRYFAASPSRRRDRSCMTICTWMYKASSLFRMSTSVTLLSMYFNKGPRIDPQGAKRCEVSHYFSRRETAGRRQWPGSSQQSRAQALDTCPSTNQPTNQKAN
jgi:hypothetical protein